jgi:hypothetical protein
MDHRKNVSKTTVLPHDARKVMDSFLGRISLRKELLLLCIGVNAQNRLWHVAHFVGQLVNASCLFSNHAFQDAEFSSNMNLIKSRPLH